MERLPPGHPSSPYNDDGSRKPPVPDPFKNDYPIPGDPDYRRTTYQATARAIIQGASNLEIPVTVDSQQMQTRPTKISRMAARPIAP